MLKLPLLLLALACSEDPAPAPPLKPIPPTPKAELPADEQQAPEATPEQPEPASAFKDALPESLPDPGSGLEGFDRARSLTAARRYREAVPEILGLLSAKETAKQEAWTLLRWSYETAEEAADLVDRLDAEEPMAGDAPNHFGTRARLAASAGRSADATAASQLLIASDAEGGSVAMAWAVLSGARHPEPRSLDAVSPEDALVLAALQPPSRRADLLATAATLESWEAKVLVAAMSPDAEAIQAAAAQVPEQPEARLTLAEALQLRADLERGVYADQLVDGARAAETLGLGAQSLSLGQEAIGALLNTGDPNRALAVGQELMQARLDAGDGAGGAALSREVVEAGIRSGQLMAALEAGRLGERMGELSEDPQAHALGAWSLARAAMAARHIPELERAAGLLEGSQRGRAEAMLGLLQGQASPESLSPDSSLPPAEAAWMGLLEASALQAQGKDPSRGLNAAVVSADRDGSLDLRLRTRLVWQQQTQSREALRSLADLAEDIDSPALHAEVALRGLLGGSTKPLPESLDPSWAPLLDPSLEPVDGPAKPFATAARQAAQGEPLAAAATTRSAYAELPVHRVGPWASLTAQDLSLGVDIESDAARMLDLKGPGVPGLLAIHDFARAQDDLAGAFLLGDDPAASLPEGEAIALHEAYASLQTATLQWLLGGPLPAQAREDAQAAFEKAQQTPGFKRALPAPQPAWEDIQAATQKTALISIRSGRSAEILAVSGEQMQSVSIRDPQGLGAAAVELQEHLSAGRTHPGLQLGNRLRASLLDPLSEVLSGKGRYLLLVDGDLARVSPVAFPESQEGLRYLIDIRSVVMGTTSAQLLLPRGKAPERYDPEFLALSAGEPGEKVGPDGGISRPEVEQIGSRFDADARLIQQADQVDIPTFLSKAGTARYLHLVPEAVGPQGALVFGDQALYLHQVRGLDLSASTAILSVAMEPQVAERWVQALRSAGVQSVVVSSWEPEPTSRGRFFFSAYEGLLQHGSPNRAFQQSRKVLADDMSLIGDDSPRWWGAYLVYGLP